MSNKSPNTELLPVHRGKKGKQLIRLHSTPEERKAYEKMLEDSAFAKFLVALFAKKFKKRRSAIMGKLVAEDLKRYIKRGLQEIIQGDAARLITQAVSQGDEAFFKALSRAVTEKKSNTVGLDKYNMAVVRLIYDGNTQSGRLKLKKEFPNMEPNFREYLKRWLDVLPPEYQYLDHRKKERNTT